MYERYEHAKTYLLRGRFDLSRVIMTFLTNRSRRSAFLPIRSTTPSGLITHLQVNKNGEKRIVSVVFQNLPESDIQ